MKALMDEIKQLIIDSLDLEDVTIDDIEDDAPLFVDGLGLDSIDALELGVAIKKAYGIKLEGSSDVSKEHFYSVTSLAKFIADTKAQA